MAGYTGEGDVRDASGRVVKLITEADLAAALADIIITPEVIQNIVNQEFITEITESNEFVTQLVENNEFITQLTEISQFIQNIVNQLTEVDVDNTYITQVTENQTFIENITQLLTALTEITENNTYVTNLITQINANINGKKGIANELATLDGSGKLNSSQIPSSLATDAEVAAAIAALVNSAPGTLDTLKELSDALGADPNFATTLATSLGGKQPLDSDLTAFAALTPSNDDVVQRKSGAWTNRTMAQLIADLAALGTTFQPLDSDLTSIAALTTTSFGRSLLALADAAALLSAAGAAASGHSHSPTIGIPYVIDGGGSAIATGSKGFLPVPFGCTITAVELVADQTGSVTLTIKKGTPSYGGGTIPTMTSIVASAKPTLSTKQISKDATLTGWTTSVAADDILEFVVDTAATITRLAVTLVATRTV